MVTKPKIPTTPTPKEWPGDLGQPIVVPFRGMPGSTIWWWNAPDNPQAENNPKHGVTPAAYLDGLAERVGKLNQLADHYGIDRNGDPGWGFLLAYKIACDLNHPGFELVYDHWTATVFKNLFGFTPFFPTKEGDSPRHRPKGAGAWAPMFVPELVALLVDTFRPGIRLENKEINDEKMCEWLAISIDPRLADRSRRPEKKRRVATLIRRLSEGRKRKRQ